jgi:hypothetical protein
MYVALESFPNEGKEGTANHQVKAEKPANQ